MKPFKPTRADKAHYEDLIEALNDAYLEGKSHVDVLQLIAIRRLQIEESSETRMYRRLKKLGKLRGDQ